MSTNQFDVFNRAKILIRLVTPEMRDLSIYFFFRINHRDRVTIFQRYSSTSFIPTGSRTVGQRARYSAQTFQRQVKLTQLASWSINLSVKIDLCANSPSLEDRRRLHEIIRGISCWKY